MLKAGLRIVLKVLLIVGMGFIILSEIHGEINEQNFFSVMSGCKQSNQISVERNENNDTAQIRMEKNENNDTAQIRMEKNENNDTAQIRMGKNENNDNNQINHAEYKGKIAITFDDGPSPNMTPQLLDELKKRNVKASFFVMGEKVIENPEIIQRMKEEGHLIGNHTFTHIQLNKVSKEEFREEILKTNEAIYEITGQQTQFIRPPFGSWDKSLEKEAGMIPVLWDIDPLDWCNENVDCIVKSVVQSVKENDIILLHDQYDTSVTAAARIIDILKEQGYEFVTVDELIAN